jgi:predicted nucleic acid-binding protein
LTLCLDARLLSEYDEVLHRPKFSFRTDKIAALLDYVEHTGLLTASAPLPAALPDPNDQPFLEVAVAGHAVCLITGNHAHFPAERCQGMTVLSPSALLAFYRQHQKKP